MTGTSGDGESGSRNDLPSDSVRKNFRAEPRAGARRLPADGKDSHFYSCGGLASPHGHVRSQIEKRMTADQGSTRPSGENKVLRKGSGVDRRKVSKIHDGYYGWRGRLSSVPAPRRFPRPAAARVGESPGVFVSDAVVRAWLSHDLGARMKAATLNVMFLPKIVGDWGQAQRARLIPEAGYLRGADLVAFQELFTIAPSTDLLRRMAGKGFGHRTPIVGRSRDVWDATGGDFSSWTPENGGVAIVGRWPILRKEQFIYADACGADWYANKGFAYTVLNVNGQRVYFLATHTQSDDSSCSAGVPRQIRRKQLGQLDAFLSDRRIPEKEPALVAGDFHIDRHAPDDYADLPRHDGLQAADQRLGWEFSFDTQDDSVARARYPGEPRQDLDYVLLRKGHRRPVDTWNNRVLKESSPEWTAGGRAYTDYSDHYPLAAGAV